MKTLYTFAVINSELSTNISATLNQEKRPASFANIEKTLLERISCNSDSVAYYFQFMAGWDAPDEKIAGIYFGEQGDKAKIKHYEVVEPFWSSLLSDGYALVNFSESHEKILKHLTGKKVIKRAGQESIAEYEVRNLLFALADGLQFAKATNCELLIIKRVVGSSLGDKQYK